MFMPRTRKKNIKLPPRMHMKGMSYYFVFRNKWTPLGSDLNLARVKWAAMENQGTTAQHSFSVAIDAYICSIASVCAENTIRVYLSKTELLKSVFGKMQLSEIKPMHIARFIDMHPFKSAARMCKAIISATFTLAIRQGYVERNPCQGVEVTGIKTRERYLTDTEFYAIRDKADDLLRVAMDLAYITGMRISDVLKVKLTDITDKGLVVIQKKTGKRQTFRITPQVQQVINRAKSLDRVIGSFYLIPNHRGQAFERRVFYFHWQKACLAAGIEDARFHDIRGKHATDMKANGQDYNKTLGHASQRQSDDYVKRKEFELVEPLNVILEASNTNAS